MQYREIPPSSSVLAPYVRFFWTLSANIPLDPQIIVPDGCPELIFHFGDRFLRIESNGAVLAQPRAFLYGQIERAIVIRPEGSATDVLGVRFLPSGLAAFTRIPQWELREQMVECRDLFGAAPEFGSALTPEDRIAVVERFLCRRLAPPAPQTWREDLSTRQNRRRFLDAVGLAPKRFQRIQRLQRAMSQLGGPTPLAEIALEAGYFDQAHFTREFREFTGQTPAQYVRQPHAISDFFTHRAETRADRREAGPDGSETDRARRLHTGPSVNPVSPPPFDWP